MTRELNARGADGWELVGFDLANTHGGVNTPFTTRIFKRRVPAKPQLKQRDLKFLMTLVKKERRHQQFHGGRSVPRHLEQERFSVLDEVQAHIEGALL
jgi:hypothetical protein